MRYCGREFSAADLCSIREMIADRPTATRALLSRLVCEELDWRRGDGRLKEMSCRVAMLRMQDDRLLQLPPPRNGNNNGKPYLRRTVEADAAPLLEAASPRRLSDLHLQLVTDRHRVPPAQRVPPTLSLPGLPAAARRPTAVLRPGRGTHRGPARLRCCSLEDTAPRPFHRLDCRAAGGPTAPRDK